MSAFTPIAIVGRSCLLPGVFSPEQLWDAVIQQKDLTSEATLAELRLLKDAAAQLQKKMVPHWRGGRIRGFEQVFDKSRFPGLPADFVALDPLFQWTLHTASLTLQGVASDLAAKQSKLFLANLGYPPREYVRFAEHTWFHDAPFLEQPAPYAKNRFSSGHPAFLTAQILGIQKAVALDAACASSLYAIALACHELSLGNIDIALAGAVSAIDPLFYYVGFGALQALSRSGQSMPFDEKADGLLPCEGAACIALKRLDDAMQDGDTIYGLVRGFGLSNDGRAGGMLLPSQQGQLQALAKAYRHAGIDPNTVSLLECHATGTPVGDPIEISSCAQVYQEASRIGIGSLKGNMGHAFTVAGMAGLLKVLEAFKHQTLPPNRPVAHPSKALQNTPFHLLQKAEPWESATPRRAGVNAFGFGGNNAHLIVEEWTGELANQGVLVPGFAPVQEEPVAVVAIEAAAGGMPELQGLLRALYVHEGEKRLSSFTIPLKDLHIPPKDLQSALAQQVLMLELARRLAQKTRFDPESTSVLIGMAVDAETCRFSSFPRLGGLLANQGFPLDDQLAEDLGKVFSITIDPASVLGTMPNILANRINGFLDLKGPSYVVEAEELSGMEALHIAMRALQAKEIDTAFVGAIDLCCEPVHEKAAKETFGALRQPAGDAGVIFVLKRLADARAQDDTILAVFDHEKDGDAPALSFGLEDHHVNLTTVLGHAHAASGLLHVAAAVLALQQKMQPAQANRPALPWPSASKRQAAVKMDSAFGQSRSFLLKEGEGAPLFAHPFMMPNIFLFAGQSEDEVKKALLAHESGGEGPVRLAIVARTREEYQLRHQLATRALAKDEVPLRIARGVYYAKAPIEGELAFVFPGAAAAYPGMGREFLLAFPEIGDRLLQRFPKLEHLAPWLDPLREDLLQDPQMVLFGSTFLCQLHAEWTKNVLGLRPQAVLGVSSGETNAVMAMEAWQDMDAMLDEIMDSGMYSKEIAGDYGVVRRSWHMPASAPVDWQSIRVLATPEEILAAIGNDPKVFLTMINAPKDCIVSGDGASVLRVAKIFGPQKATPLGHDIVAHCPLMKAWEKEWRAIHCRKTRPVPGIRFYSNASGSWYEASQEAIADALTNQATGPVDFRRVVEAAYKDGVRIFLEHGPRSSTTHWIEEILGDRPHLAVSLDRPRGGTDHAMESLAQLWTVGIDIPFERLPKTQWANEDVQQRLLTFTAHPKPIVLPSLPELSNSEKTETTNMLTPAKETMDSPQDTMIAAPKFASVFQQWQAASGQQPLAQPQIAKEQVRTTQVRPQPVQTLNPSTRLAVAKQIQQFHAEVAQAHQQFLGQQERALNLVSRLLQSSPAPAHASEQIELPPPMPPTSFAPSMSFATEAPQKPPQKLAEAVAAKTPQPTLQTVPTPKPATPRQESKAGAPPATVKPKPAPKAQPQKIEADVSRRIKDVSFAEAFPEPLPGPKWSREDLEYMSYGKLSKIFGPEFAGQDQYARQVRMPMPPLLLAEEVLGIDGEPKSMASKATMWTASLVPDYLWCLHHGRLPAFLGLEVGQADLLLISWLGVDFENKGRRMYRLLGCDVIFNGDDLARPGQRIMCDIHIDGYAKAGPVRVFFFHTNAWINQKRQVTTLSAQAGFFTEEELKSSGGVIWDPKEVTLPAETRLEPPLIAVTKTSFNSKEIQAFTEGRPWECFGDALRPAQIQQRTPTIARGPMCLFDEVTDLDVQGGPWKRGYIRAVKRFTMEEWFYDSHFYNDPCMPGTLMCEGAFEVLSFYLAALGLTLNRDGFHFVPVPGKVYPVRARGQVVPGSKEMIYEIFIRELHYNNEYGFPYVEASLLCTVDGRKAFLCETGSWALVPGHPLDSRSRMLGHDAASGKAAVVAGVRYDRDALLTLAWGKLSDRFGERYNNFDGGKAAARLAGPPYLFLSRIAHIGDGEMTAEYDLTPDCWLFSEQEMDNLGTAIFLEMGKQASLTFAHITGLPLALGTEVKARLLQAALSTLRTIGREDDVKTLTIAVKETAKQHLADHIELQTGITITAEGKTIAQGNITLGLYGAQLPRQALARTEASQMPASKTYQHTPRMLAPFSTLSVSEENDAVVLQLPLEASWIFACNTLQDPHLPASFFVAAVENALAFWLKQSHQAIATHTLEALHRHDDACFGQNLVVTIRLTMSGQNIQAASRLIADDAVVMEATSTFTKTSATLPGADIVLDVAQKAWVVDCRHGPFGPALPLSLVLNWLAKAALDRLPGRVALDMTDVTLSTMLPLDQPLRLRLQGMPVDGYRVESMLQYWDAEDKQFKLLAKSLVLLGEEYMIAGKGEKALANATVIDNPYEAAMLFQGPVFAAAQHLSLGKDGIDAVLNPDLLPFADTILNAKLLDAALALVAAKLPREDFMTMLPENAFFVPWTVKKAIFRGPTPTDGRVEVRVRFAQWEKEGESFWLKIQILTTKPWERLLNEVGIWAEMTVLYRVIANPWPLENNREKIKAFLAERRFVPNLGLSEHKNLQETLLQSAKITDLPALPGLMAVLYGQAAEAAEHIAVKEHIAPKALGHPAFGSILQKDKKGWLATSAATPLARYPIAVTTTAKSIKVADTAPFYLDLEASARAWGEKLGLANWLGADLFYALVKKFSHQLYVSQPSFYPMLAHRGVVYFANHQLDTEGLLFSIFTVAFLGKPTFIMARKEVVEETWLADILFLIGERLGLGEENSYLGFVLVERSDPREILEEFKEHIQAVKDSGLSLLIHVEGEHAKRAGQRLEKLSASLVDMVTEIGVPIVPLRFAGALPKTPVARFLDYPVGFGQQDVYMGMPILPEQLKPFPSKIRKEKVLAALNALGPQPFESEEPLPADVVFAQNIEAAKARFAFSGKAAVLYVLLKGLDAPSEETRALLAALESQTMDQLTDPWLKKFALSIFKAK